MKQKLTIRSVKELTPDKTPYEVRDTEINGFLLRIQPSGCMTYYFVYRTTDGKKKRTRLGKHGTLTPIQARDAAMVQAGKVAQHLDPQAEKKAARLAREQAEASKLNSFIETRYEPWATDERKTGAEIIRRVKRCFPFLLDRKLEDIDKWTIESWQSQRRRDGVSPATINRDVTALRSVLSKAVEWGIIKKHPLGRLKTLSVDTSPMVRYLSPEEEGRLREALAAREGHIRAERDSANEWRRARGYEEFLGLDGKPYVDHLMPMILLSLNTGMRRGEVFNLSWRDIDLTDRKLTVIARNSKNGNSRVIPLNEEACNVMERLNSVSTGRGLVFPNKDGAPFNNVKTAWAKLLKDAKIYNFRWHDMRHHFASKLRQNRVDLQVLKELLGHSDIKMTLCYAHIGESQLKDAVNTLTPPSETDIPSVRLRVV